MHEKIITPYSSIMSIKNSVNEITDPEGWDPSVSEEDEIMLSRSSRMTRDGAWSKASEM